MMSGSGSGSPRLTPALLLALSLAAGCASILPLRSALSGMDGGDVDVVVERVAARYPQIARLVQTEAFTISLDSIIAGTPLETPGERALVRTAISYMLGETIGRQWVARLEGERAVFGSGHAVIAVYRGSAGERYLLEATGWFSLYLPVSAGARREGVESLAFSMRAANQPLQIAGKTPPNVFVEITPHGAVHSQDGPVFQRWTQALYHLGWDPGAAAEQSRRDQAIARFLAHAPAHIGPVIRLELPFATDEQGLSRLALGRANRIDLVLPDALIAGNRELEQALERLSQRRPDALGRLGSNILMSVGHFFFHAHPTGPADGQDVGAALSGLKDFRIPPGDGGPSPK